LGIDASTVEITELKRPEDWKAKMTEVMRDLSRILKPSGYLAFEVGEVTYKREKLLLEELVLEAGVEAGLEPVIIMINDQEFTKTSNAWGVDNQAKGTNTNRIVIFVNQSMAQNLTFSGMLNELQRDEGHEPTELVSAWNDEERANIAKNFRNAWKNGEFAESEIRLPSGLSNQSRGTRLWKEFRPLLEDELDDYEFKSCKLGGYPDKRLVSNTGKNYAFEDKAHTKWDEGDGNRVVICSSTKRLRGTFKPPINHIWATLYHSVRVENDETVCTLHSLQLHFVEPGTLVARRLEISTSNKLLSSSVGNKIHTKEIYGALPE
tara:strand:- start:719 stop:1681 length:963 start_codon:yes stop_codon:yes gene_type:complete